MSIRDWGRREKLAHDALKEVDEIRLKSFERSFQGLGFPARDARLRAYVAYAIMMGDSILKETLRDKVATEEFVDLAVQLLARCLKEGTGRRWNWHEDPDFVTLLDYQPFLELLKPRG